MTPKICKVFRNESLRCMLVKGSAGLRLGNIALAMVKLENQTLPLMACFGEV